MVVQMAFNPARAVGFLHGHGHTQEQAQAVVEVVQDAREGLAASADMEQLGLAMRADLEQHRLAMKADLDLAFARLEARFTRLLWLQLGAYTAAAVGAIVVAGVVWG